MLLTGAKGLVAAEERGDAMFVGKGQKLGAVELRSRSEAHLCACSEEPDVCEIVC